MDVRNQREINMQRILRNVRTLARTPGMPSAFLRWQLRFAMDPTLKLPCGGRFGGFRDFSEYWSAREMIPTAAELEFFRQCSGKSGIILDVGANLGAHALSFTSLRPGCDVHAFEPSNETRRRLVANIKANDANVLVLGMALSDCIGRKMFDIDPRSPGRNHLLGNTEPRHSENVAEVEVTTIDDYLAGIGLPNIAFIKIDVEGFEPAVLHGAATTLRSGVCDAVLMELCPANLENIGSSLSDLFDAVHAVGWEMYFLETDGTPGERVTVKAARKTVLTNVAVLPR